MSRRCSFRPARTSSAESKCRSCRRSRARIREHCHLSGDLGTSTMRVAFWPATVSGSAVGHGVRFAKLLGVAAEAQPQELFHFGRGPFRSCTPALHWPLGEYISTIVPVIPTGFFVGLLRSISILIFVRLRDFHDDRAGLRVSSLMTAVWPLASFGAHALERRRGLVHTRENRGEIVRAHARGRGNSSRCAAGADLSFRRTHPV